MTAFTDCPFCHTPLAHEAQECAACGLALAEVESPPQRPRRGENDTETNAPPPHTHDPYRVLSRLVRVLVLGTLGGLAVSGGYWWVEIRPRLARIERPETSVRPEPARGLRARVSDPEADLDRELSLPLDPLGLTAVGDSLLLGNRETPWGFVRLRPRGGGRFESQRIAILEQTYNQRIGFSAVTWDGARVVGYTEGAWFQRSDEAVFTLHEPETLRILSVRSAPSGLGCLAWDGKSFWAATRLHTPDAGGEALLYRLDPGLRVRARLPSPALGCQGMAWDGRLLWLADVFSESLYVLDVGPAEPVLVHRQETGIAYLSGLAYFDGHLWLSEYGNDRLYRINDRLRVAWSAGQPRTPQAGRIPLEAPDPESTTPATTRPGPLEQPPDPAASGSGLDAAEIARLRGRLRSDDPFERDGAKMRLERAGIPVDYDRDLDSFAPKVIDPEEVNIDDWAVEIRDGTLTGWWRLRFGPGLFENEERTRLFGPVSLPLFARYEVTVEGGSLPAAIEHNYDAHSGENRFDRAVLATGLGTGTYTINLFVHVQFVDREGKGRILNQSAMSLRVEQ